MIKNYLFPGIFLMLSFSCSLSNEENKVEAQIKNNEEWKLTDEFIRINTLIDSSTLLINNDARKAFQILKNAQEIAYKAKSPYLKMFINMHLGTLHFYNGLYPQSVDYYAQVLKSARELQAYDWLGKAYFQLGAVRLMMEDYQEAQLLINNSKRSFLKFYGKEEFMDLNVRLNFHNNNGVIKAALGDLEEAKKEFESGVDLVKDLPEQINAYIRLLNNLGDNYLKSGDLSAAFEYYGVALELLKKAPNTLQEAMLHHSLAKASLELKHYDDALYQFHKGLTLAKRVRGYSHLRHLTKGLYETYEMLDQKDSTLFYLQLAKSYEDTLNLKKTAEKILREEIMEAFAQEQDGFSDFIEMNNKILKILIISFLIVFIFLFLRNQRIKKNFEKVNCEKHRIQTLVEESQEKIDTLERQMEDKHKELTLMSMHTIQSDEFINQLSNSILKNRDNVLPLDLIKVLQKLQRNPSELALADFEVRFKKLNIGFYEKLSEQFPDLTLNERRLSAFLKLQLTTKEISAITGQSIRAIEIGRTRLRKKIKLTNSDISLYDFFMDF